MEGVVLHDTQDLQRVPLPQICLWRQVPGVQRLHPQGWGIYLEHPHPGVWSHRALLAHPSMALVESTDEISLLRFQRHRHGHHLRAGLDLQHLLSGGEAIPWMVTSSLFP